MTPEEHLEARAEQLVEAIDRTILADPTTYHGSEYADERRRWISERILDVVRTERSAEKCKLCAGVGSVPIYNDCGEYTHQRCIPCHGSGSVPGELLVVGLIGGEG